MSTIEKAAARLVSKPRVVAPPAPESLQGDSATSSAEEASLAKESEVQSTESADYQTSERLQTCELDFPWLAENGFLVPGHENPKQASEFRRIKRPLLLNTQASIAQAQQLPTNTIFITSSLSGEGKTFVSLNLALSLAAELDKSVLLIDGDAAKGDLSRWMGIDGQPGLVDLLVEGQGYGESAIVDTNVDHLQVMPCGTPVDNLDELYASSLMATLVSGLAGYDPNRIVIVDGPPLIATTEASVLARCLGQVVLIVEANETPQSVVEQAASQLADCQLVSMVLNKSTTATGGSYGYGYGYGDERARYPAEQGA